MSQKHLYGQSYDEMNPPVEWETTGIQATINDDAFEASINTDEFTFVGEVAEFIQNTWIPQFGVFNGVPYRQTMTSEIPPYNTVTVFDGFINISEREILSESGPIIFRAPIVDLTDNVTVFDRLSVISQGLLVKQGFITNADAIDIPTIRESKKNIAERTLILGSLGYDAVTLMIGAVQNMLSAISDIVGISAPVGIVELGLLFVNVAIEIDLLLDRFFKHFDLLFPPISYYKGMNLKTVIEKAFESQGMTVEFGDILDTLENIFLMPSQDENNGFPGMGFPGIGILNTRDDGYLIGELIQTVQKEFNTRRDIRGTVAHIKTRSDPFWSDSPSFQPDNVKIETSLQYQNGTKKEDVSRVKAVWFMSYQYDPTDTHTLTDNLMDSYEIHRQLINELNPRMNTLKGIDDIQIPYAIGVRKSPFDNLWDLFSNISGEFDLWLSFFQDKIDVYSSELATAGIDVSAILDVLPFSSVIGNREGVLKIDDNAFGIPKMIYMTETPNGLRIPENHKDKIGAKALYNDWYKSDSPADVNDFKGQYVLLKGWRIPFGVNSFLQTKTNPYFELDSINTKFTTIDFVEEQKVATTDAEQQKPFDTNITEIEI